MDGLSHDPPLVVNPLPICSSGGSGARPLGVPALAGGPAKAVMALA